MIADISRRPILRGQRIADPYMDRRSGEDRRQVYSIDYFLKGNQDRRNSRERRTHKERRNDCIQVNEWSSICPDIGEVDAEKTFIIRLKDLRL